MIDKFYSAVVPINMFEEVLIGKRKEDGIWTTPAGGANPGESPEDCAVRECFEEAGLLVDKDRLELIKVKTAPNGKPVHCFLYRTNQTNVHTAHDPDQEVAKWKWVSAFKLPKALTRKKNVNRLETINEAFMKYYGLTKSSKITHKIQHDWIIYDFKKNNLFCLALTSDNGKDWFLLEWVNFMGLSDEKFKDMVSMGYWTMFDAAGKTKYKYIIGDHKFDISDIEKQKSIMSVMGGNPDFAKKASFDHKEKPIDYNAWMKELKSLNVKPEYEESMTKSDIVKKHHFMSFQRSGGYPGWLQKMIKNGRKLESQSEKEQLLQYVEGIRKNRPNESKMLYKKFFSADGRHTTLLGDLETAGEMVQKGTIIMDHDELVNEHKKLVDVLESPSHKDDKKEAKKQKKELKQYVEKAQGVPEGANQATFERCVQHLKDQGHGIASAHAICISSGAGMKKSGEGSRGGKVIGHTRSGKAIYGKPKSKKHDDFTAEDHQDAAKLHGESSDPRHPSWHHKLLSTTGAMKTYKQKKKAMADKRDTNKKIKDLTSKIKDKKTAIGNLNPNVRMFQKGGEGSGKRGHQTSGASVISLTDKLKGRQIDPGTQKPQLKSKAQEHLEKLKTGATLEGAKTKSGKPILLNMDHAIAQRYSSDDHKDAMNVHYDLSQKVQGFIDKHKSAGHEVPEEVSHIAKFHDKKFKEHFKRAQYESDRQDKWDAGSKDRNAQQKSKVKAHQEKGMKKAVTQMEMFESPVLDTGQYSTALRHAPNELLSKLWSGMQDFEYGDTPREIQFDKGVLSLVKVEEGLYTGYFKKVRHVLNENTNEIETMEDKEPMRIERITVPDLAHLLMAKEFYAYPMDPEEGVAEGKIQAVDYNNLNEKMAMPAASSEEVVENIVGAGVNTERLLDKKIHMLELVHKLLA